MDENQRRNSSDEEDDISPEEETEASCLETNNFTIDPSSLSKALTVKDLTRQPLRQTNENQADLKKESQVIRQRRENNTQADSKKPCSNLSQNKETGVQISKSGSLVSSCLLFFLLILCGALYMHWVKPSSLPNKQLDAQKLMSDLKSDFEDQPALTYRVIEKAIERASSENSESPGIIVLISSRKTKDTTDKLADRLVQLVSNPPVLIDFGYSSPAKQLKKEIDNTIQGNLTEQQMRAVLVRNLDRIPFEAAMIFHSYCDHENAPFKRVVYVMTAFVEETIPSTFECREWDDLATKRLKAAWKDSGEDQVASLISRLTGSVAAVVSKGS